MAKWFIDPGHGGSDPGAINSKVTEKAINLIVALQLEKKLLAAGQQVMMSRRTDITVSLDGRCKMANDWGADYFVSVHHNAGGGDGYEVIHSIYYGVGTKMAESVAAGFASLGQNGHGSRATYSREGSNGDYYAVIRSTKMPAIITEYGFMDSNDYLAFDTEDELIAEGNSLASSLLKFIGANQNTAEPAKIMYRVIIDDVQIMALSNFDNAVATIHQKINNGEGKTGRIQRNTDSLDVYFYEKPEQAQPEPVKHMICGGSEVSAEHMAGYLLGINSNPKINIGLITPENVVKFCQTFIDEGKKEGISGDKAFCQSLHETGNFSFSGDVKPEQNNFAGIGATGGGAGGASFENYVKGIIAQIQHLKAYANTQPLVGEKIDPRFDLVTRGVAPNWEDLNGRWAVPGTTYGQSIIAIFEKVKLAQPVVLKDWKQKGVDYLLEKGYITEVHDKLEILDMGTFGTILKNIEEKNGGK